MHSRIFTLRTRFEVANDDFESYHDQEEMAILLHADYVDKIEKFEKFSEDIDWFAESYGIDSQLEEFKTFMGIKTFGVIAKSEMPKLVKKLRIVQNEYMKQLKKAVDIAAKSENPDISNIRYLAGRRIGFFFDATGYSLMDELEYLDYNADYNVNDDQEEDVVITEIYDYH